MIAFLDSLARRLVRRGIRRGVLEGSAPWLVITAAAGLFRLLSRPERVKVSREDLALGESIIVTHLPAPPRGRRARRAGERAHDAARPSGDAGAGA